MDRAGSGGGAAAAVVVALLLLLFVSFVACFLLLLLLLLYMCAGGARMRSLQPSRHALLIGRAYLQTMASPYRHAHPAASSKMYCPVSF